jgi:hypothetical protein
MFNYLTQIKPEDGSPMTSRENLLRLTQPHGSIIGAIHRINPSGDQTTIFFFFDGFSHETNGFLVFDPDIHPGKNVFPLFNLKLSLQLIPGLANNIEGSSIVDIILTKEVKQTIKDGKTANITFRAPISSSFGEVFVGCIGITTMDACIEQTYTDTNCEVIEGSDGNGR